RFRFRFRFPCFPCLCRLCPSVSTSCFSFPGLVFISLAFLGRPLGIASCLVPRVTHGCRLNPCLGHLQPVESRFHQYLLLLLPLLPQRQDASVDRPGVCAGRRGTGGAGVPRVEPQGPGRPGRRPRLAVGILQLGRRQGPGRPASARGARVRPVKGTDARRRRRPPGTRRGPDGAARRRRARHAKLHVRRRQGRRGAQGGGRGGDALQRQLRRGAVPGRAGAHPRRGRALQPQQRGAARPQRHAAVGRALLRRRRDALLRPRHAGAGPRPRAVRQERHRRCAGDGARGPARRQGRGLAAADGPAGRHQRHQGGLPRDHGRRQPARHVQGPARHLRGAVRRSILVLARRGPRLERGRRKTEDGR
ncbi:hypothetical protein TOPH_06828, partial [Tolypocladium ophioglossoides CBS 100239]